MTQGKARAGLAFISLSVLALWIVGTTAQDDERIAPPSLPAAPPPASGNQPPATPSGGLNAPPPVRAMPVMANPTQKPIAMPVQPAPGRTSPVGAPSTGAPTAGTTPSGTSVSMEQSRSHVIESFRPERVKVYPDDPNSAWWEINPHYAFARAQREQRPLLLLFTGMWNTQAMALSEEVFSTKSFNEFVKENLVICYLHYERNFTDNPDALRRLKEKFKVKGYPNVILFNPSGEVEKGIRGYRSGRPIDYFNRLRADCDPILASIETRKAGLLKYGYRDWSNYLGKVIFAKYVERDATHVRLQDVSGVKWLIKINDLNPDDQRLAESFPAVDRVLLDEEEPSE